MCLDAIPVSYTHLDVYKRQVLLMSCSEEEIANVETSSRNAIGFNVLSNAAETRAMFPLIFYMEKKIISVKKILL